MTVCKFGDKFCFNTQPPEGGWAPYIDTGIYD